MALFQRANDCCGGSCTTSTSGITAALLPIGRRLFPQRPCQLHFPISANGSGRCVSQVTNAVQDYGPQLCHRFVSSKAFARDLGATVIDDLVELPEDTDTLPSHLDDVEDGSSSEPSLWEQTVEQYIRVTQDAAATRDMHLSQNSCKSAVCSSAPSIASPFPFTAMRGSVCSLCEGALLGLDVAASEHIAAASEVVLIMDSLTPEELCELSYAAGRWVHSLQNSVDRAHFIHVLDAIYIRLDRGGVTTVVGDLLPTHEVMLLAGFALAGRQVPEDVGVLLMETLGAGVQALGPQCTALFVWCLGRTGVRVPQDVVDKLITAINGWLDDFEGCDYCLLMWGLGKVDGQVPVSVVQRLCVAMEGKLYAFAPQHFTLLVWGLGMLQVQPPAHFVTAVLSAVESGLSYFGLKDIVSFMMGVSKAGCASYLSDSFFAGIARRVVSDPGVVSLQQYTALLCGMGQVKSHLEHPLPTTLLRQLLPVLDTALERGSPSEVARFATALARIQVEVPSQLQHSLLRASLRDGHRVSFRLHVQLVGALLRTGMDFPASYFNAVIPGLLAGQNTADDVASNNNGEQATPGPVSATDVANFVWVLGRSDVRVPRRYSEVLQDYVEAWLIEMRPWELRELLVGFAALETSVSHSFAHAVVSAVAEMLDDFAPADLVDCLSLVVRLEIDIPQGILESCLSALQYDLDDLPAADLATLAVAFADGCIRLPDDFCMEFCVAVARKLRELSDDVALVVFKYLVQYSLALPRSAVEAYMLRARNQQLSEVLRMQLGRALSGNTRRGY